MPSSDAFAFQQSGLNEFLFAPVGTEANGMTLSLGLGVCTAGERSMAGGWPVGQVAKIGSDRKPGAEHHQHADQPLAASSRDGDRRPLDRTAAYAVRRVRPSPPASPYSAKADPFLTIAVMLVCAACVVAFEAGVFTLLDAPAHDGSSVASFAIPPANDLAFRTYVAIRGGSVTAAVVVARRAVGQGRARRVRKMSLLPGTSPSSRQCRINRVMQPAVPLRGHRRSILFAGVYHPATGSQAAATL